MAKKTYEFMDVCRAKHGINLSLDKDVREYFDNCITLERIFEGIKN
jgi:hypothetical protein